MYEYLRRNFSCFKRELAAPTLLQALVVFSYGLMDRNPPKTALRFLRYNLPWIIGELTEKKG